MGLCLRCRDRLPPDLMHNKELCEFCERDTNELIGKDGVKYTKEFAVKDYEIFLNKLKDSEALRNKLLGKK